MTGENGRKKLKPQVDVVCQQPCEYRNLYTGQKISHPFALKIRISHGV